jgi:diacylglycerol kinase family enzyme
MKSVPHRNPYKRFCQTHLIKLSNDIEANDWYTDIRSHIVPAYTKPISEDGVHRLLLVIVNPIGGKGKGEYLFKTLLKPMLDDAGTGYEVIVTTGPGHAEEVAKTFDTNKFGAVAVVGGDGLFGEIMNGMNSRQDREAALSLPLGVLPAGSSNCLACSVGLRQPLAAAFSIARGVVRPLDVLKVTLSGETEKVILSVCGVSYGFISEVNTFAGRWRWLFGPARYTVCGLRTIMSSPMEYHVDCRYQEPDADDPAFDKTECGPDCKACLRHADVPLTSRNRDSISPILPDKEYVSFHGLMNDGEVPSPSREVQEGSPRTPENRGDKGWIESAVSLKPRREAISPNPKDNTSVLLFSITNLSIRQSQNYTVWNNHSHMASGYMDLVLMPVMSRISLLTFLARYNKGTEAHKVNDAVFSVIKAKSVEMKITKIDEFPAWEKAIQIAIDGETHPLQPLRVDTLHGFLNLMCS